MVGAYLAYYSERQVDGRPEQFCNLGAWCVLDGHRHQGIRLLTRLLAQKGYHFTDFSPSGNVVPLNRRLKFTDLDTTTTLVPNVPLPRRRGDARVTASPDALLDTLSGEELALYRDHQHAAAAKHLVVSTPARALLRRVPSRLPQASPSVRLDPARQQPGALPRPPQGRSAATC